MAAGAQTVRVGLEPMPPLINGDGTGFTVDLLRRIEGSTTLKISIALISYNRAKDMPAAGSLDLIAHSPFGLEKPAFYA